MTKKYLLFSMNKRQAGLDSVFGMLNRIFKEAKHLNRIPVIGRFIMDQRHNMGKRRAHLRFEDYLDLSNGITVRFERGCHRPAASCLEWMKEQELDLAKYASDKVYNLADDEIVSEEMNQRYDVLIRRDPTFKYATACKKYEYDRYLIDFPYSERVNRLTDEVLSALGTSRQDAITAQHYLLSRFNSANWCDSTITDTLKPSTNHYVCMHVRMSDRESQWPVFDFSSSKKNIESILEHSIAKGSRLYIMSDIHQADFFDFLKSDYRVYRYHDFPKLRKIVSGEDGSKIDNVMLYLIEKNIMKHATVKILPPHKGPMVYHLNTVYNLSILKKTPVLQAGELKRAVYNFIRRLLRRILRR